MGSREIPDIVEVKSQVAEIIKIVAKLYDRLIIPEPMVTKVEPDNKIKNIWDISELEDKGRRDRKMRNN